MTNNKYTPIYQMSRHHHNKMSLPVYLVRDDDEEYLLLNAEIWSTDIIFEFIRLIKSFESQRSKDLCLKHNVERTKIVINSRSINHYGVTYMIGQTLNTYSLYEGLMNRLNEYRVQFDSRVADDSIDWQSTMLNENPGDPAELMDAIYNHRRSFVRWYADPEVRNARHLMGKRPKYEVIIAKEHNQRYQIPEFNIFKDDLVTNILERYMLIDEKGRFL